MPSRTLSTRQTPSDLRMSELDRVSRRRSVASRDRQQMAALVGCGLKAGPTRPRIGRLQQASREWLVRSERDDGRRIDK